MTQFLQFLKYTILTLICLLATSEYSLANKSDRKLRFSSLDINNGLSQNTVYDVVQDIQGNLWIATADGLNKFDGYRFTVYRHEPDNPNSIESDFVRTLHIDNNQLMIGTRFGLSLYDIKKNIFRNFALATQVNKIVKMNDSIYYIIAATGIYEFNCKADTFEKIYEEKGSTFQTSYIYNEQLLVGTNTGLYVLNTRNRTFTPFHSELVKKNVQDILPTNAGLWVATEGKGLYFVALNGAIKNYRYSESNSQSISSDYVRSLRIDPHNNLWVGTFGGLNILNRETDTFSRFYSSDVERHALNQNSVRSIFCDQQGGMWIGTFFGGLNYYHPLQNQFGRMRHIPHSNTLNDNVISCIVEGDDGDMWIGTNDKGLNRYNTETQTFTYYTTNKSNNNAILSNNIKAVLVDGDNIYIGSHGGGLARLNKRTNHITNLTIQNSDIISNNVYALKKDNKGNIWVATLNGLISFNPKTNQFTPFATLQPLGDIAYVNKLSTDQIYTLYFDSKNRIWIGAESGIYTYSLNNKLLTYYDVGRTDKNGKINCFLEDSNHRIWIGTHSGLRLLSESSQTFKTYTTKDGLPNNNIFGILQDSYNRLWISTNKGLASFTPTTEKTRVYNLIDGIQSDQFNNYSYCKTSSGEMFFGGINGITHFTPEGLLDNPFTPQPVISQFSLFNEEVLPGDDTGILTQIISETSKIKLTPKQTSFSLSFTVPNFLSAEHNTFAYMLKGIDPDWNYMYEIHPVSYSNLSPGEYTFSVKAANSDGKWNENPTELQITISPFWWQTTIFKLIVFAFILILAYIVARFFHNKQVLRNQLVIERIEKDKKDEINQMKLRFFINISHEFRTPLTLIISPLQELLNKTTDKWTRDQIKVMQRNANKLLYLVNQLMDYRRAELGVFALKVVKGNPCSQIEEMMNMYERLAKQNNIDFVFENYLNDDPILHDPSYLDLILSNLLSNAFKFTPNDGCITIKTNIKDSHFVLEVSDTGKGISKEAIKRIFERFYQANTEDKGTGIGLSLVKRLVDLHHGRIDVESEEGKGTTFLIHFPQDASAYTEIEMKQDSEPTVHHKVTSETIDLLEQADEMDDDNEQNDSKQTILIVEDDTDVRNYLVSNLSDIANIQKTDNGEDALKIIKESKIDLIITDVMLPIMDGIKLCKTIKQNIRTSHIPIIMLTAKTNQQDQMEGLVAGADDYMYKPFNISILKVKVQNMMKSKTRMLEHYSSSLEVEPEKVTFNEMDREFLQKAKKIVEENLDNINFSVDDFCQEMAMSRSNLHLKMKAITGESTIEFIRKIRFNEACNLLKDGRYSIAEISTMVGFNTPSYFTTSFKKYFNILPTEYVKKLKNNF